MPHIEQIRSGRRLHSKLLFRVLFIVPIFTSHAITTNTTFSSSTTPQSPIPLNRSYIPHVFAQPPRPTRRCCRLTVTSHSAPAARQPPDTTIFPFMCTCRRSKVYLAPLLAPCEHFCIHTGPLSTSPSSVPHQCSLPPPLSALIVFTLATQLPATPPWMSQTLGTSTNHPIT